MKCIFIWILYYEEVCKRKIRNLYLLVGMTQISKHGLGSFSTNEEIKIFRGLMSQQLYTAGIWKYSIV